MVNLPAPPYSYETGKTSASCNWKVGAGNGRHITGITIHHWGSSNGLDFDGIVNFLCSPRPANPTSAHYVAQGRDHHGNLSRRVSCIVDPDDIAYACGNWSANLSQISIECRPEGYPEDREVVAQLIARLRNQYGPLPLVGHQHWVPDDCPGSNWMANLAWLDQRANQILSGVTAASVPSAPKPVAAPAPAPAPAPKPAPAPVEEPDMRVISAPGRTWLAVFSDGTYKGIPAGVPVTAYANAGIPVHNVSVDEYEGLLTFLTSKA